MSVRSSEVRQCPKCQQPAVVLVNDWQHTTWGGATGESTKDYRCQHCGAWQTLPPTSKRLVYWVAGVMAFPLCGAGIPFLWLAWRAQTFESRVPLRIDAPLPRLRFPGGPPKRTCAKCGGVASAVQITRHTHKGIPTGTEYVYACAGCQEQFTTENLLGHVTSFFLTGVCLAVAAAFFFSAESPGWKWGGTLVAGAGGLLLGWQWLERVLNRFKHKELEQLAP